MIDFTLSQLVMRICAVLIVSTAQGAAIAAAAVMLGDKGPHHDGRLTLNPFAHIDLIGGAMGLIFAVGWSRWVAVDPRALRHGRVDLLLVWVAGVLALVLGVALLLWGRPFILPLLPDTAAEAAFAASQTTIEVALAFALLSVLPMPPLAGGHLLDAAMPALRDPLQRLSLVFAVILAAVMFTGTINHVLDPVIRSLIALMLGEDLGM